MDTTYRAKFDGIDLDQIATQANKDQQAGISVMRGREQYTTISERAHYNNAWLAAMIRNGVPAKFAR